MFRYLLQISLLNVSIQGSFSSDKRGMFKTNTKSLISEPGLCPALSYFLGVDNKGTKTIEANNSNFCPMVARTACTKKDFHDLKNWWELPVIYSNIKSSSSMFQTKAQSRFEIRTRKLEDIAAYTWEMLNIVNEIRKRARLILMADKGDARCAKSAERFQFYRFREDNYRDYLKKAESCWRFTNGIQTKVLCDVCDPKAQENFNMKEGKIYINGQSKSMFESACLDMVKTNLSFVFPYLEVLEPLVRCNLDGKMSTKDRLRLRRSERIWDDLEDGMTDEMISYGLTFGEEVNLNSEGDARFVTFQFRNLKDFLEQKIEGQNADERKLKEHMEKGSSKTKDSFKTISNSASLQQRRRLASDIKTDTNTSENVNELYYKKYLSSKKFKVLAGKSEINKDELIDAISERILSLRKGKAVDGEINQMIKSAKRMFKGKLSGGVSVEDLPKFDRNVEKQRRLHIGKKARSVILEEQHKQADKLYEDPSRIVNGKKPTFRKLMRDTTIQLNKLGKIPNRFAANQTDKPHQLSPPPTIWKIYTTTKKGNSENMPFSPNVFRQLMLQDSPAFANAVTPMPGDFQSPRRLTIDSFVLGSARRLGEKEEDSQTKKDLQVALDLVIKNLEDEFNNGDLDGFKKSYPKDKFVDRIQENIRCLDLEKTNVNTNGDQLFFKKSEDCMDFTKDQFKPMVDYLKENIEYPETAEKVKDQEDFLKDKVTEHLDEIHNNLTKEGKYQPNEKDENGNDKKIRRLSMGNLSRKLSLGIPERPKDSHWNKDDEISDDGDINKLNKRSFPINKMSSTANPKISTDVGTGEIVNSEKDSHETEKQKIGYLEHKMSQKLDKLFKQGKAKRESGRIHDTLSFAVDTSLKYDMLAGIGKTGYAKIDFEEGKILKGLAIYKRLDESIQLHTNWINSSSGLLKVFVVGVLMVGWILFEN